VIFVLLVTVADIVTFWGSLRYLARRKRGDVMSRYWLGPFSMGLTGLAWASLALIALPDAQHHADLRAIYLLFIVGCSATKRRRWPRRAGCTTSRRRSRCWLSSASPLSRRATGSLGCSGSQYRSTSSS